MLCTVAECSKEANTRQLCRGHHHRLLRYGDPTGKSPNRKYYDAICSVEGCDNKHFSKSFCQMHFVRFRNHGSPDIKLIRHTRHGMSKTREYYSWQSMKKRCYKPNEDSYKYYGGRGITVCGRWLYSFTNFFEDMGKRPIGTTLERIDVDGNYEPSNCKWATDLEQANNRHRKGHYKSS